MVGTVIRQARTDMHLSLRKLSKMTGLSHSLICDIEHDRANPSIESLGVLARALRIDQKSLFNSVVGEGEPTGECIQ